MSKRQTLVIGAWLIALGYLGLYLYGLFLGVFSPGELIGFTLLAIAIAVAFAVHVVRYRWEMARFGGADDPLTRKVRRGRETRGF